MTVDAGGRYAISLLSGHEGGANELALQIANILDAEPVITTTTEALKTVIAGIGCRRERADRNGSGGRHAALDKAAVLGFREVRLLASADIKADETGLLQAATLLGIPLRFIAADEIRKFAGAFTRSDWTQKKVNLPAVAEPAALLAGRRTRLILPKTTWKGVHQPSPWRGKTVCDRHRPGGRATERTAPRRPSGAARLSAATLVTSSLSPI